MLLPESRIRGTKDRDIQRPYNGIAVHGAVGHWGAGHAQPDDSPQPHPFPRQGGLAAGRLDAVGLIHDDQVPPLLLSPVVERLAPERAVVDDANEWYAPGFRE